MIKDELCGKKGRCSCGAVFKMPLGTVSEVSIPENNCQTLGKIEICTGCLKTIQKQESRVIINGQVFCIDCEKKVGQTRKTVVFQKNNNRGDSGPDVEVFDRRKIIRKNFFCRLLGCLAGMLIVIAYILIKGEVIGALFVAVVGVIFIFLMVKKGYEYDLKVTKDMQTYYQYKSQYEAKKKKFSSTPKAKLAVAVIILVPFPLNKFHFC
jgi:hypothetical protein